MEATSTDKYVTSSALPETALIWSEKGLSSPKTLSVGDNVIDADGRLYPVKEIVDCGKRTIYRVILANGMRTESTFSRCLQVEKGTSTIFKPIEDIQVGDRIVTVSDPKHPAGANATLSALGEEGLTELSRDVLKKALALLFTSKTPDGCLRSDIDMNEDNDIIFTFEAANSDASSELQQILLGRFGVRSERFRNLLTISNEQFKLLTNKIGFLELVFPTASCPLSDDQFDDMLSLCHYETDRDYTSYAVTDISGRGRFQAYGIKVEGAPNILVDGMVSDFMK